MVTISSHLSGKTTVKHTRIDTAELVPATLLNLEPLPQAPRYKLYFVSRPLIADHPIVGWLVCKPFTRTVLKMTCTLLERIYATFTANAHIPAYILNIFYPLLGRATNALLTGPGRSSCTIRQT